MARPRLLVLTQHYFPEPNFITQDVANRASRDFDVTVLTAHPNYPVGRFAAGTRWWTVSTSQEGAVRVIRVPFWPDHSASAIKRLVSYLSFAFAAAVVAIFRAARPDVIWIYHGEFTVALAALPLVVLRRPKTIVVWADLWPESIVGAGHVRRGPFLRALFAYRRMVNRLATRVVASTAGIARRFQEEGVSAGKVVHIPVWIPTAPASSDVADHSNELLYAGNLGPAQPMGTALEGMRLLQDEGVAVSLIIVGDGTEVSRIRAEITRLQLRNTTLVGRQSLEEVIRRTRASLAQLISLSPDEAYQLTVPSKLYFAIREATPIIFACPGDAAAVLRPLPGTFEFEHGSPTSFSAAVKNLLALTTEQRAAASDSLRATYARDYDGTVLADRHARELQSLVA